MPQHLAGDVATGVRLGAARKKGPQKATLENDASPVNAIVSLVSTMGTVDTKQTMVSFPRFLRCCVDPATMHRLSFPNETPVGRARYDPAS